ncbi:RNF213 [Mytilus edulis]|uniref:RNF213 n=1 Tax=Mytilus edulis TaxID=6550 RepID=A0A8S3RU61_MYTED|nr:RNF213 [Mytilus edulis]
MGETGCGKTSLIQYLANLCGIHMDIFSIHAGISEDEIYSRLILASQNALKNVNEVHWLFLDEINTCDHLGIITSAICHRFCNNYQLAPNLALLAACNPYRLRREDSIYTTGTQQFSNFHGLRDFYSLTKYIGRKMKKYFLRSDKNGRSDTYRNTSQLWWNTNRTKKILETFSKYIPCIASTPVHVMRLIRENIKDKTSRHLMLITRGNVVISVLERELNEMKLPFDIIFGSNFEEDLNDDYNYQISKSYYSMHGTRGGFDNERFGGNIW